MSQYHLATNTVWRKHSPGWAAAAEMLWSDDIIMSATPRRVTCWAWKHIKALVIKPVINRPKDKGTFENHFFCNCCPSVLTFQIDYATDRRSYHVMVPFLSLPYNSFPSCTISTSHTNTVIRPIVVTDIPLKNRRYIPRAALIAPIVLTRTIIPRIWILNVNLSSWLDISQK
jgi:hypothetical protein